MNRYVAPTDSAKLCFSLKAAAQLAEYMRSAAFAASGIETDSARPCLPQSTKNKLAILSKQLAQGGGRSRRPAEVQMRLLVNGIPALGAITGVGSYTLNLLSELARRPEVEAIGVFDGLKVVSFEEFARVARAPEKVRRYERLKRLVKGYVPFARKVTLRLRQVAFSRACRKGEWSVYHEPNYLPQRFNGRVVVTVHDMCFMRRPEFLPRDRLKWLRRGFRRAMEEAHQIITVSRFTRDELLTFYPHVNEGRVRVIHEGVDGRYFAAGSNDRLLRAVKERLELPERFILYVGRIEPRKNVHALLQAFSSLPEKVKKEHPLVLAGPMEEAERDLCSRLQAMKHLGLVKELGYVGETVMPFVMRAATLLCFPSIYEGFGLPPLEAAACGTPVVCSNTASLPEVMGDAAVYVDPRFPEDIARGLLRALEDNALRESLRRKGPERAALFTWEKCATQTLAVYHAAS